MKTVLKILSIAIFILSTLNASELKDKIRFFDYKGSREKKFRYSFVKKEHSIGEIVGDVAIIYGVATLLYPLTQPEILDATTGSWSKYKKNFGRLVFDQDEPFWNFFVHPLTGGQMFLYYRSKGYSKMEAFRLTFFSSALFEFTIETFSEPASIQDLFNTPILGSLMGLGIEELSFYLLNSGSTLGKFLGHIINPCTMLWFYDGKMRLTPYINGKGTTALRFVMDV